MQGVIRDLEKIWSAGVFGEGEATTQTNKNAAQESGGKLAVKDQEASLPKKERIAALKKRDPNHR